MVLGEAIRYYRKLKGINQKQLADRAGLTVTAISMIEMGRDKRPPNELLQRIVRVLEIEADLLYGSLNLQAKSPDFCLNPEITNAEAGRLGLMTQAYHVYVNCP